MVASHRARVEELLIQAQEAHRSVLAAVPADVRESLPVDAQGITRAIDHLGVAAGLNAAERKDLIRPHAVNPAVLHARVFGGAPLTPETVLGAFVEGARVRADALVRLASAIGPEELLAEVHRELLDHPLPVTDGFDPPVDPVSALREAYAAQERVALLIAARLDAFSER